MLTARVPELSEACSGGVHKPIRDEDVEADERRSAELN